MPVDNKEIKKALDNFEEDDFIKSKDIIKAQVKGAVSDYFKDRLELKNDLEPKVEVEVEVEVETDSGSDE